MLIMHRHSRALKLPRMAQVVSGRGCLVHCGVCNTYCTLLSDYAAGPSVIWLLQTCTDYIRRLETCGRRLCYCSLTLQYCPSCWKTLQVWKTQFLEWWVIDSYHAAWNFWGCTLSECCFQGLLKFNYIPICEYRVVVLIFYLRLLRNLLTALNIRKAGYKIWTFLTVLLTLKLSLTCFMGTALQ